MNCSSSVKFHFLNSVRHFTDAYSCAVDSFLEVWIACIGNLRGVHNTNCNEFFERMSWVDNHYKAIKHDFEIGSLSFDIATRNLIRVREHIWSYLRRKCVSLAPMNCDAVFSEIFRLAVFGSFPSIIKDIFISTFTYRGECPNSNCLKPGVKTCEVFVHFISSRMLNQLSDWETILFHQNNVHSFQCEFCNEGQCIVSDIQITSPSCLFVEFSAKEMSFQRLKEDLLFGDNIYKLHAMVRSRNAHFSSAVSRNDKWELIDDLNNEIFSFTSLYALYNLFPEGWFFFLFTLRNHHVLSILNVSMRR